MRKNKKWSMTEGFIVILLVCLTLVSSVLVSAADIEVSSQGDLPVVTPPIIFKGIDDINSPESINSFAGSYTPYSPSGIKSAYNFPDINASGKHIAIIEAYGDPSLSNDIAVFNSKFGLSTPTIKIYYPEGKPSGSDQGWAIETAMDVEWAQAMAPGATIDVIVAPDADTVSILNALEYAINDLPVTPSSISMSFGLEESLLPANSRILWENLFAEASEKNIILIASSGDSGAYNGSTYLSVNYPASSPYVMGIGGTSLYYNGSSYYETGWYNNSSSATGGGYSVLFDQPSYQSEAGIPGSTRGVPDVALVADPATGVYVYCAGMYYCAGGTSLGAPIWAAIVANWAAVNSGIFLTQERLYNQIYSNSEKYDVIFNDITIGNNGYYVAESGWDAVTGMGTPDVNELINSFNSNPSVKSFTPTSGITGTAVTITGNNFNGATAVSFGGTAAAGFTVNSNTQITAIVGSGSTGKVSVTTPAGNAMSTGSFNYTALPVINSFSPTSGGKGTSIIIKGVNLNGAKSVKIGGVSASKFKVDSSTQITATIGSGSSGKITVTTSAGTALSPDSFTYYGTPKITSITPTSGGSGTALTIKGVNLDGVTAVSIGGTSASSFTVDSSTRINAIAGSGSSGKVTVTTPGGTATSSSKFTYYGVPVISSFTPAKGGKNTSIIINGSNFTKATSVSIGGVTVSRFKVNSATKITATAGSGSTGKLKVTTPGGTASSNDDFVYYYIPTIKSISKLLGGTGSSIVITGTNFEGATGVKIGTKVASGFTVDSSTQITAIVGSGSTGKVTVTTPGGTATSSQKFTYYSAPKISSFTPLSGGEGTSVTIKGSNLKTATSVTFGESPAASFKVSSNTKIVAIAGNGVSGKITVTTAGGTATSVTEFIY